VALLAPGDHVRMHLQRDRRLRVFVERGLEHASKGAGIGQAEADRRIACGLVDHQHRARSQQP
jgi:hypothetical protein